MLRLPLILQSVSFQAGDADKSGYEDWMADTLTFSLSEFSCFPLLETMRICIVDVEYRHSNIALAPAFQGEYL